MSRRRSRSVVLAAVIAVAPFVVLHGAAAADTPATWAPEALPPVFGSTHVNAMTSTSSADVYAAGFTRTTLPGVSETRSVVLHYDGSSWSRMVTPGRETAP